MAGGFGEAITESFSPPGNPDAITEMMSYAQTVGLICNSPLAFRPTSKPLQFLQKTPTLPIPLTTPFFSSMMKLI
jgi:hypothetical protein